MDRQKLIHQLFIGKVAEVLGMEKTNELLNEAKEAFAIPNVKQQSEQFYCSSSDDGQYPRCETQCLGCAGLEEQAKQ